MYKDIDLWYEPRNIIVPKIDAPEGEPEMSEFESAFLAGTIRKFKPRKILEIGIAAGGTSSIILQCMDMLDYEYELHSVDYAKYFYRGDGSQESGYLSEKAKKICKNAKQKKYLGTIIPNVIDEIGGDIDLVLIDTVHALPGEILDFLVVMPYLSKNAVVVLHDLVNNFNPNDMVRTRYREMSYCTKILFDSLYGEKYYILDPTVDRVCNIPNIGAVVLNDESRLKLANVVNTLSYSWFYFPDENQWESYSQKIEAVLSKYNCLDIWHGCVDLNRFMLNKPYDERVVYRQESIFGFIKRILRKLLK